jgi:hypothetical protein
VVDLPPDGLQLAGDALLLAIVLDARDAAGLARRCASALEKRSWEGDAELVVALGTATGDDSPGPLVALSVDLEELAEVIDGASLRCSNDRPAARDHSVTSRPERAPMRRPLLDVVRAYARRLRQDSNLRPSD